MFFRKRAHRTAEQLASGPHCSMCGSPTTVDVDGRCPLGHQVADAHTAPVADAEPGFDPARVTETEPGFEPAPVTETGLEAAPPVIEEASRVAGPDVDKVDEVDELDEVEDTGPTTDSASWRTSSLVADWEEPVLEDATLPDSVLDTAVPAPAADTHVDRDAEVPGGEAAERDHDGATPAPAGRGDETADGEDNVTEARERLLQAASWFSAQDG